MVFEQVNYLAVLVASVASFIFGWAWYSPILFGNLWMKLNNISKRDMKKPSSGGMAKMMIVAFITTLITACVLSSVLNAFAVTSLTSAIYTSFLIWLGFLACTTLIGSVLWDNKPLSLFFLNGMYWLVNLELIGIILFYMI